MTVRQKARLAAVKVTEDALAAALELVNTASQTAARLAVTAAETAAELTTHKAICLVQYASLKEDIKDIRGIIVWVRGIAVSIAGALFVGALVVVWAFVKREWHLP